MFRARLALGDALFRLAGWVMPEYRTTHVVHEDGKWSFPRVPR